ncbi:MULTISPECIES: hypothetical protein [unclassified Brevundimonas]|uniref:hypothetical protein n=1 Tax=unclassified Brevundimonas TaxID=2622653 RepID=UPI001FD7CCC1|nr:MULTISPECIES: hypothetical protein [unclassified Brevundimonas]
MTKAKISAAVAAPMMALAAATVALPATAEAQAYRHGPAYERAAPGWQSITQRKYNLDARIDRGVQTRQISHREASRLKNELNSLVRLERSYMRGGLTRWERQDLDRRYDRLSAQVRYERNDWNNRRR